MGTCRLVVFWNIFLVIIQLLYFFFLSYVLLDRNLKTNKHVPDCQGVVFTSGVVFNILMAFPIVFLFLPSAFFPPELGKTHMKSSSPNVLSSIQKWQLLEAWGKYIYNCAVFITLHKDAYVEILLAFVKFSQWWQQRTAVWNHIVHWWKFRFYLFWKIIFSNLA